MGFAHFVPMDQTLEHPNRVSAERGGENDRRPGVYSGLAVVLFASLIFPGCIVSPPGLMDDVDAVQAQIARNNSLSYRSRGSVAVEGSPRICGDCRDDGRILSCEP